MVAPSNAPRGPGEAGDTPDARTLAEWLAYIEARHAKAIDLGLDRVRIVSARLGQRPACPVVTVAGTNGKGSTCAMLERILGAAGYRVGLYTSPHLLRYNERVRIAGREASDEELCAGFARVEAARGDVPLTYFEFGTLAAWEVFAAAAPDAVILEVGLGGRLDATNVFDADCAVVTGVDLDHMEFLGNDRESIAFEKAGILRPGRPAVCGDPQPPGSLLDHAKRIGAGLQVLGRDFGFIRQDGQWQFWGSDGRRSGLAHPALRGARQLANASTVLATLDCLRGSLPVAMRDIREGLATVELPGRFQVLPGRPTLVLDVAHNPQAARTLAENLGDMAFHPRTWAVFGMLRDKDMAGVIDALRGRVDAWLPAGLEGPRGASGEEVAALLGGAGETVVGVFADPGQALRHALENAGGDDRILAFGSFLTVAHVMRAVAR
ncbi:MAG: bifunctional tetrahydrofolate synthase/dihydrofolate synthase [Rhodocyclaceae bacterium]|nr:bifunctional tetrahydrofolate synthase/dihydrofolate synthase [Rhodocyclaceae bacterium]